MDFRIFAEGENLPLLDQVRLICKRLSPHGWGSLFKIHDLDIDAKDFRAELLKTLRIDHTQPGFEDFARTGKRAIEPYSPPMSLLYHALASPRVVSFRNSSGIERPLTEFPSLAEIHTVENLVYGIEPISLQELRVKADNSELAIAVFASEYRPGINTVHQKHADICFSRVGISRVGNEKCEYFGPARGYLPFDNTNQFRVRVTPCYFSAYVAVRKKGNLEHFGPMRFKERSVVSKEVAGELVSVSITGDDELDFWVPVHKLFGGNECIRGLTLNPRITAKHVNEKIRRVHKALAERGFESNFEAGGSDIEPYVFYDGIAECNPFPGSAACEIIPVPHAALVEEAKLAGSKKPLTYKAPRNKEPFRSSVLIEARRSGARSAPEYVHVRHQYDAGKVIDLNERADMIEVITRGGFEAIHYKDFTGEGVVLVECPELSLQIPEVHPGYSMVSPVDFFPLVKQQDLMSWWKQSVPQELLKTIWPSNPGPPVPLSDIRYPGNLSLTLERLDMLNVKRPVFREGDKTISAVIGALDSCDGRLTVLDPVKNDRMCTLPDGASGVFAPGWDSSVDRTEEADPSDDGSIVLPGVTFFNNYGLGSPFPEDAMLCAALSSFWPAAAPDITRVFAPGMYATATPLTDDVIGLNSGTSWNQVPPPVLNLKERTVEYQRIEYSDFVRTALDNRFDYSRISEIRPEEYAARTLAMARAYINIGAITTQQKVEWALFSFQKLPPTETERIEAEKEAGLILSPDYTYRFMLFKHRGKEEGSTHKRVKVSFDEMVILIADPQTVLKRIDGKWQAFRY